MLLQHNKINFLTIFPNFRPNYALYIYIKILCKIKFHFKSWLLFGEKRRSFKIIPETLKSSWFFYI